MNTRPLITGTITLVSLLLLAGCHARSTPFERASCSSLVQCKQPLEPTLKAIADMGFHYVDVSCLSWTPHVNVDELVKDFDKEAGRVKAALKANHLKPSNLTFDAIETKPFEEYQTRWAAVVKLAVRVHAPLINIMAPSATCNRPDQVAKLRIIHKIAADQGIKLTLETHSGQITELPADAEWLCKQVPGLGLTLDPSHYYAGPNQGKNFDNVYPYVMNTGLRAGGMEWKTIQLPWGTGPIDFAAIVHKLEARGYKGYYVVEYLEGFSKADPLVESRKFLAWIREM
jgi:sugar phosphate isomerase/epimerase